MIARTIIAIVAAIAVAILVIRNAAVFALADTKPADAVQYWSRHPVAEISAAMTEIARSARNRRPVSSSIFAAMADAAAKEPLAPEPYLVRGVQAELAGDGELAQRAFEAAQWRDPRSLSAAYFLADRYFKTGDVHHGLREIAALARLSPNGPQTVAPYLGAYAKDPANWGALRALFRSNPDLADPALTGLASKLDTVPAVLALADPRQQPSESHWLEPLLSTLTQSGRYSDAYSIWLRTTHAAPGELLHDSAFADHFSPPPFNWSLTSSTVGLAERQPGARLHVIFYGQEDGFLASQLLLLPPGAYQLSLQLLGDPARAHVLSWSVWCDKAANPIASATVDSFAARPLKFQVPAGCGAQWLRLAGASSDISQQTDVTIANLKLQKQAPDA
ncbi:MAG TPA: hypothetical protein VF776_05115 [Sphingomicrobium sp.]